MLGGLDWASSPYLVVEAFMSVSLFPEALDPSDAYEGGRFSLKLDREKVHSVRLGAFDGEASPTASFRQDA
jgi:hypothetical protein